MEDNKNADFLFFVLLHQCISSCPDPALSLCHISKEIPLGIRDVQGDDLIVNASLAL